MQIEAPKLSRRQPDGLSLEKRVVFHVHGGRAPAQMTSGEKGLCVAAVRDGKVAMTTDSRQPLYLLVAAGSAPRPNVGGGIQVRSRCPTSTPLPALSQQRLEPDMGKLRDHQDKFLGSRS